MRMPELKTTRLRVREFTRDDLPHVFHSPEGEERREWLEWTVANYRQFARLYQPPYGDRAVILRDTGKIIGVVGLVPAWGPFHTLPSLRQAGDPEARFNSAEMGLFYEFRPEFRGRGYATEAALALIGYAFGTLGLRRIIATTEYNNDRSQALMRRIGMTINRNPASTPPWFQIVGILENDALP